MKIRDLIPFNRNKSIPVEHINKEERFPSLLRDDSLDNLFTRFDEITKHFFDDFGGLSTVESRALNPKVNVSETAKNIVVEAEVPGVDENDLHVTIDQDHLILKGEKKSESKSEKDKVHRFECSYGAFERVIPLPEYAKLDGIKANYKKGVLNITIPKDTKKINAKTIPITVS